jgi:Mlc titration factor MtfA (ptsG expression regulator)
MIWSFKSFRRGRILKRASLDEKLWRNVTARFKFLRGMTDEETEKLRRWVILFLHEKKLHAAGGLELTDTIRLNIAVQACILIVNLDLDFFRGWVEVIVYPDEFLPEYEVVDDAGVVHTVREPASGESWEGGPVVLSWADVRWTGGGDGYNVVIHEFAHKLDMLEGAADGCPPLHRGMDRRAWVRDFSDAYDDFCDRVDGGENTAIDPYGAESPSEFFAVMSESFFELPRVVSREYDRVYGHLRDFYRQDPVTRLGRKKR